METQEPTPKAVTGEFPSAQERPSTSASPAVSSRNTLTEVSKRTTDHIHIWASHGPAKLTRKINHPIVFLLFFKDQVLFFILFYLLTYLLTYLFIGCVRF